MSSEPMDTQPDTVPQTAEKPPENKPPQAPKAVQDSLDKAKKAAAAAQTKNVKQVQPPKQYLESTVVPMLVQGLQQVARERPADPVEYLGHYLIKHNPNKKFQQQGGSDTQAKGDASNVATKPGDKPDSHQAAQAPK